MTGSDSKPDTKHQDGAEKRRLDDTLREGLEETFPGLDPVNVTLAAAVEGRPSRQTARSGRRLRSVGLLKYLVLTIG